MRVCHVTYEYPPHIYGGLGRHVAELTSSLHTAGAEVAVATVAHPRQRRRSRHDGIDVYRVNGVPVIGDGTPWRDAVRAFDDGLSPVLDEAATTADVIHAHDWFAQRTVLDHCRRRGTPLVVTVHATERGRHQGWLPDALNREIDAAERQLASAADRVVVCSDWMAEHVVQIWELEPSRVRVVPNGVTPAAWPEARGGTPEYRVPVVLFAGRLEHEKGGQVLIDALAALKVRGTAAPAAFAGDGSQRVAWHEHAKTVGVVVAFLGRLGQKDLSSLYRRAGVVVVPSLFEPYGMVAAEAMAAGAAVVASEVGGLADVVGSGGALVPPGDAGRLAAAIEPLLTDDAAAERARAAARARAAELPSWQDAASATLAIYSDVV